MKNSIYQKSFRLILIFLFTFHAAHLFAQTSSPLNIAGGHSGNITALIHNGSTVLTAGEDGFLVTWNVSQRIAVDRFQMSTFTIQSMVKHPSKNEVCIVERSITGNYNRLSAWNYASKQKLFSITSSQPITFVNYSAAGNLIIAAGIDGLSISIINSSTGAVNKDPVIYNGVISAAVTGRTERNVMIYQSDYEDLSGRSALTGQIIYLSLVNYATAGNFQAPEYMSSSIFIMNDRILAGVNQSGLHLVDTATGNIIDSNSAIGRNSLLCPLNDGFYCYARRGNTAVLYRFTVANNGRMTIREQTAIPPSETGTVNSIAYNGSLVFSTSNGKIYLLGQQNRIVPFESGFQKPITEIAAGEKTIALFSDNGNFSILPADYAAIKESFTPKFNRYNNYGRISAFSADGKDYYIIWQNSNTRYAPQLFAVSANEQGDYTVQTRNLSFLTGRFPLRVISVYNNKLLTLDTGGNLAIRGIDTITGTSNSTRTDFTFSSVSAIDAAFINNDYLIISRSVIDSPFISVNAKTGETVPYPFPVQAGLKVFAGKSGSIYGAAIEQRDTLNTVFLNISASDRENRIMEYYGEAHNITITESRERLVIACDTEGVTIFANQKSNFQRTNGLPVRLYPYGNNFLCLDTEGNITWHDTNGRILSTFSLHADKWSLSSGDKRIFGEVLN